MDSHLDNSTSKDNVTFRHEKRKRGDVIEDDFKTFTNEIRRMMSLNREYQDGKFNTLHTTMSEIKQQNVDISKSLDFMSEKYEDLKLQLEKSEHERKKGLLYIRELETRVTNLERSARNTSIEIRNLPQKTPETKKDLIKVVTSIGTAINVGIEANDIKYLFRYDFKLSNDKTLLIVELTTVLKREAILDSAKEIRKSKKIYLNISHIRLNGPTETIYLSECLPPNTKRLYAKTRKFASDNNYEFCSTKHGSIFLRKEKGSKVTKIVKKEDLNALAPK
jgi:virulence-associated protein VapD